MYIIVKSDYTDIFCDPSTYEPYKFESYEEATDFAESCSLSDYCVIEDKDYE